MSACLRSARPEDASDVVRVLRASRFRFLPYAPPVRSEAEDLSWAIHSLIPSGGVTIASIGARVVGVLAVSESDGVGWIDQLYVEPEYCGRGIGTQLLRAALNSLRKPIRLYTFQENVRACRFYEGFGFQPIAFGDGSENEEGRPDTLYEFVRADDAGQPRLGVC